MLSVEGPSGVSVCEENAGERGGTTFLGDLGERGSGERIIETPLIWRVGDVGIPVSESRSALPASLDAPVVIGEICMLSRPSFPGA